MGADAFAGGTSVANRSCARGEGGGGTVSAFRPKACRLSQMFSFLSRSMVLKADLRQVLKVFGKRGGGSSHEVTLMQPNTIPSRRGRIPFLAADPFSHAPVQKHGPLHPIHGVNSAEPMAF